AELLRLDLQPLRLRVHEAARNLLEAPRLGIELLLDRDDALLLLVPAQLPLLLLERRGEVLELIVEPDCVPARGLHRELQRDRDVRVAESIGDACREVRVRGRVAQVQDAALPERTRLAVREQL